MAILIAYTQTVVEGWDPVAYLYAGQRLAEGKPPAVCSHFNAEIGPYFTLAGFNIRIGNDRECLYLNYPPGFPALLAIAQKLSGKSEAALYVPAVFGGLALLCTFTVGTLLFDKPDVGLMGAFLLLCAPAFLQFSTSPWSDGPGTALLIGGVAAIIAGERSESPLGQIGGGLIGALLMGLSVFTRYVNGIAFLPLTAYLGLKYKATVFKARSMISFVVCSACVLMGILTFNRIYYGGYLFTSYSPAHGWYDWPAFSVRYAFGKSPVGGKSFLGIVQTLVSNYSWLVVLAAVGFFRMPLPERALTFGSCFVFVVLYGFYAFAPVGINARFLLPVFPFIGISIGYAFASLIRSNRGRWWYRLGLILAIATMLIPLPAQLRKLAQRNAEASAYVERIVLLTADTETSAVFLAYNANDAITYYGNRTTLFYRRIPWRNLKDFESSLTVACESLLRKRVPVYFVVDREPPLGDSLMILQRHFDLVPLNTALPSYKLQMRD